MAQLRVVFQGKLTAEITLDPGKEYIAGRKEGCDIPLLGDKAISREHFRLVCENGTWLVKVLSRFGEVLFQGQKILESALSHHATFQASQYSFELLLDSSISHHPPSLDDKTVVGLAPSVPYIKVMSGKNQVKSIIKLDGGEVWVAGRESIAHIHIDDARVSRKQFEIRRQGIDFFITDLGSVNGTFLNGNPLPTQKPVSLNSGDAIAILDNYLHFELHDPQFKKRLELVSTAAPPAVLQPSAQLPMSSDYQGQPPPTPLAVEQYNIGPYQIGGDPDRADLGLGKGLGNGPGSKKFDFEKHRLKLILGTVALLLLIFLFANEDSTDTPKVDPKTALDPYSKLTAEQQSLVKQSYQLAKNYYLQGRFESARGELVKMKEFVPEFQDSESFSKMIEQAIFNQQEAIKNERLEKEKQEREQKISDRAADCQKKINPKMTPDQMDECLTEVIQFDPSHPKILALKAQVDRLVADQNMRAAQRKQYNAQVGQLRALFERAERIQKTEGPLEALAAYQKVIRSKLPDPKRLKGKAKSVFDEIKMGMKQKSEQHAKTAEQFYEQKKLREAITSLRQAIRANPESEEFQEKIDQYTAELKKQMMVLYQEGILEESFGNVFGGESKSGAMEKWKKIIELDIPDGEYYRKAAIKIKKYGSQ